MLLAINWSHVGWQIFYLILSLSILVILHEFGHFITAKWFKCRVEKFYLFFDPWFSIFKKKIGETVYGIGWLPLGGYVKIAGMIDESMDKEQMKQPPQPYEFRSKPAWQRLIIMLAGIIMNVLLAFFIYAMVLLVWGEQKIDNASVKNGIWIQDSLLHKIGLENGDKIIAADGKTIQYFDDVPTKLLLSSNITIDRNGEQKTIDIPHDFIGKLIESKRRSGLLIQRIPSIIGDYDAKDTSYGKKAGLKQFDKIVAIDSANINFYDEMMPVLQSKKNQQVNLKVQRNDSIINVLAKVNNEGKIGLPTLDAQQYDSLGVFKIVSQKYTLLSAFPAGVKMTFDKLKFYIDQFKLILKPSTGAYKGVGGFKAIGSIFPTTWGDWEAFWKITAFLSIILAFMNILPIPALDGGHALFTLAEIITGRKPSDKFLEYAQVVGMVLLLALMVYANANDWIGWGK